MSGPFSFDTPSPTGSAIPIAATGTNNQTFTVNADAVSTVDEDATFYIVSADGTAATNDDLVRLGITVDADNERADVLLMRSRNGAAYGAIATSVHLGTSGSTENLMPSLVFNSGSGSIAYASGFLGVNDGTLSIVGETGILFRRGAFGGSATSALIDSSGQFVVNTNMGLGQTTFGSSAAKVMAIGTGTAPGSSPADAVQLYSADQAAGNACLHTRTEGGAIVKLFQGAALTAADASTVDGTYGAEEAAVIGNIRTRLGELEARLQAHGLIA